MTNSEQTHEWRLTQLEDHMEKIEAKLWNATLCLIGNLVGVVLVLLKLFVIGGK